MDSGPDGGTMKFAQAMEQLHIATDDLASQVGQVTDLKGIPSEDTLFSGRPGVDDGNVPVYNRSVRPRPDVVAHLESVVVPRMQTAGWKLRRHDLETLSVYDFLKDGLTVGVSLSKDGDLSRVSGSGPCARSDTTS
jgi:hypothetical protein